MKARSEEMEQRCLAAWLDSRRIDGRPLLWFHCPNGGQRNAIVGAKLKRQGVKRGVPDVLILDHPPKHPASFVRGIALELKAKGGVVSTEQHAWLEGLKERGWVCRVAFGFDDAKQWLESLGY